MEKIENWVKTVETLAEVAKKYPQSAYSGFTHSLQMEWQYIQQVIPRIANLFEPLEKSLQEKFLPALLGESEPTSGELRNILALSTKAAGIGIWNPIETSHHNFTTSQKVTKLISDSLIKNKNLNVSEHQIHAGVERRSAAKTRNDRDIQTLNDICKGKSDEEKRRLL